MLIGFIGLGIMGKPMLAAGHELVVSDHNQAAAELVALGAKSAGSAKEIAGQVDLVITMLPNSPQVRQVALGAGGIVEADRPGLVYVDLSSIAPLTSREVAGALAEKGIDMLDAPVSGGEPKAIDRVHEVLAAMGGTVVHVGEIGAGNIAKLANQVVVALNIAAVSEALVLAQKAGVSPETVFAAIRSGLAGSTVLNRKGAVVHNAQGAVVPRPSPCSGT